ncbi:hypothetical protein [Caldicellulosiruptor acetigenus]|uniref:Uncharacterized protein n=1 Tax=Caldicellulosiruptor acetigenus 6A TaxID=632516 RepID=G2PYR6_9FIRM|nr:hypothetical protein [Caldicellulosiruptor acetigenus]AEM74985.1 hypothetical protein Calla_2459 [Caldicellulosiruptor acetigenus 6A]
MYYFDQKSHPSTSGAKFFEFGLYSVSCFWDVALNRFLAAVG